MAHKIILKCRICLDEFDEENMFDLFKETIKEESSNFNSKTALRLSEKVEFCCGVKIRESVEMPSKICEKCYEFTRIWYNFRQLCVNTQVYLESLCKDRPKPNDIEVDEHEYLQYLLDDLQTFRNDGHTPDFAFHTDGNETEDLNSEQEIGMDTEEEEEEYLETISLEEGESEQDINHMIEDEKKPRRERKPRENVKKKNALSMKESNKKKSGRKNRAANNGAKSQLNAQEPESFMCSICGNVYNKKSSFTYHMGLHSNVKPHECELCGKNFRQVCELKNHMRRHTGERPYKCSYCDRHFIDRSEKHRHERVHTNTRPYICTVCGKSFMYSAILKNHSKLHSGEKEFNCLVCHKAFTLQHQLKAHLQTLTHKQRETQFISAGYEVVYE